MKKRKTKQLAIGAVMSALSVVVLYVGAILDVMDISSACLASFAVLFFMAEYGTAMAFGVYAAISILSFIVLPQKLPAFFFALLFGIMPITKCLCERLGTHIGTILSYSLKLLIFNAELVILGLSASKLLELPESMLMVAVYILLSNVIFVLADRLYGILTVMYFRTFRKKIEKYLK